MLRNNLIVAWRNLRRYRMYTAINVGGLAAAFAVAIFVGLYIHSELTWDRFHVKGEQIYQVCETRPAWKGEGQYVSAGRSWPGDGGHTPCGVALGAYGRRGRAAELWGARDRSEGTVRRPRLL